MFDDLNKNNVMLFAAKVYDKPHMIQNEFEEDFRRVQYIKRLITKYQIGKPLREKLLLNHLVIFYNVFGISAGNRILFCCLEKSSWPVLKPFLVLLNYLEIIIEGVNGINIHTDIIPMDHIVIQKLREI